MSSEERDAKPLAIRQRKAHRKSRLGCGNCKLRSVKCDETKPTCKRCAASGFECSYSRAAPSLQLARGAGGAATMKLTLDVPVPRPNRGLPPPAPGLRIPVAGPVVGGPEGSYELTPADFAALDRFRARSVTTVGNPTTMQIYRDAAFNLGSTDPFLLHVFLAFSLLHDTYLSPTASTAAHRASLAFHWYHGTALFNRNLCAAVQSNPTKLPGTHRDALWTSAALLGSAAFAYVGVSDPQNAWPLKEPEATDLDWLKMSDGKRVVWDLTDPSRPESIFHPLVLDHAHSLVPNGLAPIPPTALPKAFYTLLDLDSTTPYNNPYYIAASIVAQLLPTELNDNSIIKYLAFISQLDTRYRLLLEKKDHKALVLLAWWYAEISGFKRWWLSQRAWIEGKAICIHLDRECKDDPEIMELMEYPKRMLAQEKQSEAGKDKWGFVPDVRMQDKVRGYCYARIKFIP